MHTAYSRTSLQFSSHFCLFLLIKSFLFVLFSSVSAASIVSLYHQISLIKEYGTCSLSHSQALTICIIATAKAIVAATTRREREERQKREKISNHSKTSKRISDKIHTHSSAHKHTFLGSKFPISDLQ